MVERILNYISVFLSLIIVLPIHEYAHAVVAYKSGDMTPKMLGRLTLNPLAHFDILGLVCFVVAGFGWAKPVPVNPNNFRHYKRDSFFVSIAGVTANYIIAFIALPLFYLSLNVPQFGYFTYVLQSTLLNVFRLSLVFFVFNLIPIYPLDGFRAIDSFARRRGRVFYFLKTKGIYVLYGLFALSILSDLFNLWYLDILGIAINFLVGIIGKPISLFWGIFF